MNKWNVIPRTAGILFAALLITKGWVFWPIVIVLICLFE